MRNVFFVSLLYNICMLVSLRQLGYVIEAASVGSVAGAAKSLNISASSILMAIDKFEEDVGLQVFVRHRARGLTVTAAVSLPARSGFWMNSMPIRPICMAAMRR